MEWDELLSPPLRPTSTYRRKTKGESEVKFYDKLTRNQYNREKVVIRGAISKLGNFGKRSSSSSSSKSVSLLFEQSLQVVVVRMNGF